MNDRFYPFSFYHQAYVDELSSLLKLVHSPFLFCSIFIKLARTQYSSQTNANFSKLAAVSSNISSTTKKTIPLCLGLFVLCRKWDIYTACKSLDKWQLDDPQRTNTYAVLAYPLPMLISPQLQSGSATFSQSNQFRNSLVQRFSGCRTQSSKLLQYLLTGIRLELHSETPPLTVIGIRLARCTGVRQLIAKTPPD